jgi:DNA-binding CsgD family transcriptional regulator
VVSTKGMLERDGVLDAIARLLDRARAGTAGTLFVLAEPGLGKTSVLDDLCLNAKDDFSIGVAKGAALETVLPFGFLSQALSDLGGWAVPDGGGRDPSGRTRAAIFYEVWRWLESATPRPALLVLDDLHWADSDSLALLSFLCRRMSALPVAVVAALRPWPETARLVAQELAHDGHARIERLKPLSLDSAAVLLAQHSRKRLDDAEVARAGEICAGNPLLLEQVGLAVARGEDIPMAGPGGMRGAQDRLLLGRFAGLPPAGMKCARAGAVFGNRFRPDLAARLADLGERDGDEALEALERSGLVCPSQPGMVDFAHPLFRQALYDDLGGLTSSRFHARAFALLVECGHGEEAVEHAIKAGLAGDPTAIAVLHRVGEGARHSGATDSAISILASALMLAGDQASPELLCDFAESLAESGRPAEAKEICERIMRLAELPTLILARTLRAAARAHVYLGEFEAAARRTYEGVDLMETIDPEFAVEMLLSYARVSQFVAGPAVAVKVLDRARVIASACDASFRGSTEAGWAVAALDIGDPSGLQAAEVAARAAETESAMASGRTLVVVGGTLSTYATVAKHTDRLAESEHYYRARLRFAEQAGNPEEEAAALFGCAGALQRLLRLEEALTLAERCAKLADLVPLVAPYAMVELANVYLLMGRLNESDEAASQADAAVTAFGAWQPSLTLAYGRAWRCLAEGRLARACELYEHLEAVSLRVGLREPCYAPWGRHAIAAYVGSGRLDDAHRVLRWLEDCARALPCLLPRIAIACGRAMLAESAGDETSAEDYFKQAMALHHDVDLPLEWLQTLLEYGRYLRRSGQPLRARPLLAQATELAAGSGAQWLADQARQELRIAGGRRRGKPDPSQLTPQEERVAGLAASGVSNAEIAGALYVSVNTVETHLRHIYAKLGSRSRRQLAAMLAAREAINKNHGNP